MTDAGTGPYAFALGVLRMLAVVSVLTVVLAAGVHGAAGGFAATVPDADFEYDYDAAADTLAVTHAGGDGIEAAAVDVAGHAGDCASTEWASGRVTTADTCVLEGVANRGHVRVVWQGDGSRRAVLDVWSPPDG